MKKIRKRVVSVLLAATLAFVPGFGQLSMAANPTIEGVLTYRDNPDGTLEVASLVNRNEATNVTIPETYGGKRVTTIGESSFFASPNLTSVSIPNTVVTIGTSSFFSCNKLGTVTMPSGLQTIENGAFALCSSLKTVDIPSGTTTIGALAFANCAGITSAAIPDTVNYIGESAFSGCSSLTSATIPEGITELKYGTFHGCTKLETVTFPTTLKTIGNDVFRFCSSLSGANIPLGVTSIGDGAFWNCCSMTEMIIPRTVTSIGRQTFMYCSGLETLVFYNNVSTIGEGAFSCCNALSWVNIESGNPYFDLVDNILYSRDHTRLLQCFDGKAEIFNVPDGVTQIDENAFSRCSLKWVTIPSSVRSIGKEAFSCCFDLEEVSFEEGVTNIGEGAFYYCKSLASVKIPASAATIGNTAFGYYTTDDYSLAVYDGFKLYGAAGSAAEVYANNNAIEFDSSVKSDYEYLAYDSDNDGTNDSAAIIKCNIVAETVTIPEEIDGLTVKEITGNYEKTVGGDVVAVEGHAFSFNNVMKNVIFPDTLEKIGKGAFYFCSETETVNIPALVTDFGFNRAFVRCDKLTSFTVSEDNEHYKAVNGSVLSKDGRQVAEIPCGTKGAYAFPDGVTEIYNTGVCPFITEISVPSSVRIISEWSFCEFPSASALTISADNEYFKDYNGAVITKDGKKIICCVQKASGDFFVPEGVTTIGDHAFRCNIGYSSIVMPKTVTTIGEYAFAYCKSISSINPFALCKGNRRKGICFRLGNVYSQLHQGHLCGNLCG